MALVTSNVIYQKAGQEGYAVGGYDSYCLEVIQAMVDAATEGQTPILIQVTPKGLRHIGLDYFMGMAMAAVERLNVPVAIHLDHGTTYDEIRDCITRGFTSVMIDSSYLPLEENIELTRRVVEFAHSKGVSVEAELGRVLGKESDVNTTEAEAQMTPPDAAAEFVERTGIDALAVAVGTVHGFYKESPRLDFERMAKISQLTRIPLVFHGGTGIPKEQISRAIKLGLRKVNIGTLLKDAFTSGIKEFIANYPDEIDPRKMLGTARTKVKEAILETFDVFGCRNRGFFY